MPRAKTAAQNGKPEEPITPAALEQHPISLEPLQPGEVMLLGKMLAEVNFPDPETKTLAASLQMKVGRAWQAAQEANA